MSPHVTPQQPRIPLEEIATSPTNPRKHFDQAALEDLTENVRKHDVMMPVLLRPNPAKGKGATTYELVAGERRYRAAKAAGLVDIPAVVRELSDVEVLEMQVSENSQRSDLHPLEEAEGYGLILAKGYDVAKLAERVGRTVHYIHDRVKLLMLTKDAKKLFLGGRFALGHAIPLARLTKEQQAKALDPDTHPPALFVYEGEHLDLDINERDKLDGYKPASVREFQAWIEQNCRFDEKAVEPLLFPETAARLEEATESAEKVVHITELRDCPPTARGEQRTYTRGAWERADGLDASKPCEFRITGVVVVGPGRGEAFKVCVANTKCRTHFADQVKEKEARKQAVVDAVAQGRDPHEAVASKEKERRERERLEEEAFKKARPAILAAIVAALKKDPATAKSAVGRLLLLAHVEPGLKKLLPSTRSAEDIVRYLYLGRIQHQLGYRDGAMLACRGLGIDMKALLEPAAPKASKAKPSKKAKVKPGRRAA